MKDADPANVLSFPGHSQPLDSNPRILAVAIAKSRGGYRLVLENHALIQRHEDPDIDDAYDPAAPVTIGRGAFSVPLSFFSYAGSWTADRVGANFRFRSGRFELIGFDRTRVLRNSGKMTETSANYATGRMSVAEGSIKNDETAVTWKTIPRKLRHLTIEAVGNGLDFDPAGEAEQ